MLTLLEILLSYLIQKRRYLSFKIFELLQGRNQTGLLSMIKDLSSISLRFLCYKTAYHTFRQRLVFLMLTYRDLNLRNWCSWWFLIIAIAFNNKLSFVPAQALLCLLSTSVWWQQANLWASKTSVSS